MVDLFVRHYSPVPTLQQATPAQNQPVNTREELDLVCTLIKISQMNMFADLVVYETITINKFWQNQNLVSVQEMADELKKVFEASNDAIKSPAGPIGSTYKQIHDILKKASTSKSTPFQQPMLPTFNMNGVLPGFQQSQWVAPTPS